MWNDFYVFPQYFVQEVGGWVSRFLQRHVWNLPALPKPLFIHTIKCDGLFFPVCRYDFHPLFHPSERRMAVQLHFSSEKGAAFFRCQLCIVSVVTLSMRSFYIMFFIYIYGNSLGVFTDDTMFTWRMRFVLPFMARLFTNYLRRVVVLSHLYFLYGVAFNFDGPFYVKGNKGILFCIKSWSECTRVGCHVFTWEFGWCFDVFGFVQQPFFNIERFRQKSIGNGFRKEVIQTSFDFVWCSGFGRNSWFNSSAFTTFNKECWVYFHSHGIGTRSSCAGSHSCGWQSWIDAFCS